MSTPAILADRPEGAKPAEIADHLGMKVNVVCVILGRLQDGNQVKKSGIGRTRLNATWRAIGVERASRAADTLAAMQAACLARLRDQPAFKEAA